MGECNSDERTRIHEEIETAAQTEGYTIGTCTRVLMHLLDICQYLIDSAYEAERMRRLTAATGMRPALLENLINLRNQISTETETGIGIAASESAYMLACPSS
ncbi:MAG: hypothetical protein M0003_05065 [Acidithiobacillus sp.]|nr:hypothetical protein [Acidithiobacillus sp.]